MNAIIFGVNGQDGHYLSALLNGLGYKVIGISRRDNLPQADISDYHSVVELIAGHMPDFVFHFAANSSINHETLFENHATIATGTLNILEAVKIYSPATRVFISGSGLQFSNADKPIKETDPFEAGNAYAMSRIQSVYAARYFRSLGVKTFVGYFFNHDSPLRTERHMTKKIAEAAKRIGKGSNEKLVIGDIEAIKEYTFAGDIVNGIWTLVNQDKVVEANISSGKGYSIKEWLVQCFNLINKNWQDHITIDPSFVPDYRQLVSDPSLINSLGWKPSMGFEDLAKLMMK